VWNDVFIVRAGGEARADLNANVNNVTPGYGMLHALNACPIGFGGIRWIADLASYSSGAESALGAPTVTDGFIYIGTDKGHLLVLGDPAVGGYTQGYLCSNVDIPPNNQTECITSGGGGLVPDVVPIVDFQVPDGGDLAYLRKEPALSVDRVFVSTGKGHVYALATAPLAMGLATDQLGIDKTTWGWVILSRPAPSGGAVVALSSSDSAGLKIPATVPIPAGVTSAQFAATDVHSGEDENVQIQASYNGASAYASLLLLTTNPNKCARCGSPARCCACAGGVWSGGFCQ
jgi:hypothetical protein